MGSPGKGGNSTGPDSNSLKPGNSEGPGMAPPSGGVPVTELKGNQPPNVPIGGLKPGREGALPRATGPGPGFKPPTPGSQASVIKSRNHLRDSWAPPRPTESESTELRNLQDERNGDHVRLGDQNIPGRCARATARVVRLNKQQNKRPG